MIKLLSRVTSSQAARYNTSRALASRKWCLPTEDVKRPTVDKPKEICAPTLPIHKPCFSLDYVNIELAVAGQAHAVRDFMRTQYWPSDPTVSGLWIPPDSPYLETLTRNYVAKGHCFMAVETAPDDPCCEPRLIGVVVSGVVCSWLVSEMEEWAQCVRDESSRNRILFYSHVLSAADPFTKYCTDCVYEVQVLGVAPSKCHQGVGRKLMQRVLCHACDLRHPHTMLVCTNVYAERICKSLGMKKIWSCKFEDICNEYGQPIFQPQGPHLDVSVYMQSC